MSLRIVLLSLVLLLVALPSAEGQSQDSNSLKRGQEEFSRQRYPEALNLLRNYLRKNPADQDAWIWFAAAYYHTGQAEAALKNLRKAKPSAELKPLRTYYIALSYDALKRPDRAKRLLRSLSRSKEPIAEDALLELASINFEDGDADASLKSIDEYLRRFPKGRHLAAINRLRERLPEAGRSEAAGSKRAQYRENFFKEHPLSLMSLPHTWFYEVGYDYTRGTRSNPGYKGNQPIVQPDVAYESYKMLAQAGLVLGPFHGEGTKSYAGYVYTQNWLSDSERMKEFFDDPTDFSYFPFRPDLQERNHKLLVETTAGHGNFQFGAYGHWIYTRGGSDIFPAPERPEIRKSFDIGTRTLFVPWVGWQYQPNHRLLAFMRFEKFLNREEQDFSYQTYNISSSDEDPFFSYTLKNESQIPRWNLKLAQEIYRHQFLFNDYWEGYVASGLAASAQWTYRTNFRLAAAAGVSDQAFTADVIRSGSCSDTGSEFGNLGSQGVTCERIDRILKFGAGASYINDKQQSFSFIFNYVDRKNDKLIVYNESESRFLLVFTHAFPTLRGMDRYIEPFVGLADSRGIY